MQKIFIWGLVLCLCALVIAQDPRKPEPCKKDPKSPCRGKRFLLSAQQRGTEDILRKIFEYLKRIMGRLSPNIKDQDQDQDQVKDKEETTEGPEPPELEELEKREAKLQKRQSAADLISQAISAAKSISSQFKPKREVV